MNDRQVKVSVRDGGTVSLSELNYFQGDLKSITAENKAKLREEILKTGFRFTPHVWLNRENNQYYLIDGHHRVLVLRELEADGFEIPPIPIAIIEATSIEDAKRAVLQASSAYAKITEEGLVKFAGSSGITFQEVKVSFDFPSIDLGKLEDAFAIGTEIGVDAHLRTIGQGEGNPYTKKIEAPIYTPTGPEPAIAELFDTTKTDELRAKIFHANIPEEVKTMLLVAAQRHTRFNYEKMAEYYAHAPKEVQALMEQSALVIIDFDKAIEYGFVELSKKLAEGYRDAEA